MVAIVGAWGLGQPSPFTGTGGELRLDDCQLPLLALGDCITFSQVLEGRRPEGGAKLWLPLSSFSPRAAVHTGGKGGLRTRAKHSKPPNAKKYGETKEDSSNWVYGEKF